MMTKRNCTDFSPALVMHSSTPRSWGDWIAEGKLLVVREMRALGTLFRAWHVRQASRRSLSELSPEGLKDIGLSVDQAMAEANKPFWQD